MFDILKAKLQENPKKIVFTEGHDARILEAAAQLKKDGLYLTPILIGKPEVVKAKAAECGFDIEGLRSSTPQPIPRWRRWWRRWWSSARAR